MQFLGPDKILIVTPAEASLRDLSLKKVLWSASLGAPGGGCLQCHRGFRPAGFRRP